jgi:hypothetical protein
VTVLVPPGYTGSISDGVRFQPLWFDLAGLGVFAVGLAWTQREFSRLPALPAASPRTPPVALPITLPIARPVLTRTSVSRIPGDDFPPGAAD